MITATHAYKDKCMDGDDLIPVQLSVTFSVPSVDFGGLETLLSVKEQVISSS